MTIEELLTAWRAEEEQPCYVIDYGELQSVLKARSRKLRDVLFSDEIKNYWTALWIIGFIGVWLLAGPGEGVSGWTYFTALAVAVASVVYFIAYSFFFVAQRRPQVPISPFALSLREHCEFELDYISSQIAARTEWWRVLLHLAPPCLACVVTLGVANIRGDGALQLHEFLALLVVTAGWIHMHVIERRWVARELVPRREDLESLRQKLVEPEAE